MQAPFLHSGATTRHLMQDVLLALAPTCLASVARHGSSALLLLVATGVSACLVNGLLTRRATPDGSVLITATVAALMLPAGGPWWLGVVAGAVAIVVGRWAFGGLGYNLFNPAALSRAWLMAIFPAEMFTWGPRFVDGVSQASPLFKPGPATAAPSLELLWGGWSCTLAEAAPWTVVLGGGYLVARRVADWRIPLTYLLTTATMAALLEPGARMAGHPSWVGTDPLRHVVVGGTLMGAFFLMTDPVTAPFTPLGRVLGTSLAATLAMLIRFHTHLPDGTALAVLVANASAPLLDRWALRLRAETGWRTRP
ncbi:MAG: RnfABCDGE type electron transport complex subunit D [Myxococcota bacterium]